MYDLHFTTLDNAKDPTFNQLLGVNNEGTIAGYFGSGNDAAHPNKGYTISPPYAQANYKDENFLGSTQTQVTGINNENTTVGFWADAAGDNFGWINKEGKGFTDVVDPAGKGQAANGKTTEQLLGINDKKEAVGFWTDANNNNHGFTYNIDSNKFSDFNIAGFDSTTTTAINNEGDIAGFVTVGNNDVAFVQEGSTLNWLSGPQGAVSVQALGVNDEDQVVGLFTDAHNVTLGFLYDQDSNSYTVINRSNTMTVANGINDKGQIVGFYMDNNSLTHGMLGQFSPDKS
jgi:hypothetical protein